MADEITETEQIEVNNEQEEVQEKVDEIKEDNKQETEKPESKESVISKIGGMVKNFVSGDSEVDETKGKIIPEEFTEAATKAGWTEDDITEFTSDYTDEELKEMIPSLIVEDSKELENPADKIPEKVEKKVEDSQEDEKTQKLLERIEALEKTQGKSQEETEQQKLKGLVHQASQMFDETSKEFEVFGKTEELPTFPDGRIVSTSPQMKARNEVWDLAFTLHKSGMDFDSAMSVSLNAYKGKNLAKDVKRSIIKDLKQHEKKLSGKHTSHESTSTVEYGPDVIREVARRAGRDIN